MMTPKRRFLSLVFASLCISKSLLIGIKIRYYYYYYYQNCCLRKQMKMCLLLIQQLTDNYY